MTENKMGAVAGKGAGTGPADPGAPRRGRDELLTLEYPRYVHKAGAAPRRVENESEARAAVADGWAVDANEPHDNKDAK